MYHNNIEMCKSYYENPKEYKRTMINSWKNQGVIYDDWNDLYDIYMNTMNCENCKKSFGTSRNRHLDHDHETGLFRKILCNACNSKDSYLKYLSHFTSKEKEQVSKKAHWEDNKDEYNALRRNKVSCFFCGNKVNKGNLRRHYNSGACPNIKPIN